MMSDELRLKLPEWFTEDLKREFTELFDSDPEEYSRRLYGVLQSRAAGEQFRVMHPEVANTQANGNAIAEYAQKHFGDPPTIEKLHRAFLALQAEGKIELDPDYLPEAVSGTSRVEARPTVADDLFVRMDDAEFRQTIEINMDADEYKRRLIQSPWFRERCELVLGASRR